MLTCKKKLKMTGYVEQTVRSSAEDLLGDRRKQQRSLERCARGLPLVDPALIAPARDNDVGKLPCFL